MRLTELNPRWTTWLTNLVTGVEAPTNGISFDCPTCRKQRLHTTFLPMIDPQGLLAKGLRTPDGEHWTRQGETFDTLTLSPSVDCSQSGCWHGHIKNGEIT
jgi:hypothetical protein